ncbi:MAG: phosphoserine phosphatase SerB [Sutterella wadsworthensis]|nr:phosphoserine phosphatase SerB [Sutterella wadsworthensis]
MNDLILMGPGVTPDVLCDLADEFQIGEVRSRANSVRLCNLSPMTAHSIARRYADDDTVDAVVVPANLSIKDYRVLCLDMDGTIIHNECIDDMAALAGVGDEVAAATRAAMEGHQTFAESLTNRVALLKDAPTTIISDALKGIRLQSGAPALIDFCRLHGVKTYILSGGFTNFTKVVAEQLGMNGAFSNELGIDGNHLTGHVTGPAGGRILDADGKRRTLEILCALEGVSTKAAISAGDGANDLEMLGAAGIGVAFHAKPVVRAQAKYQVTTVGLDGLMLLFKEAWD